MEQRTGAVLFLLICILALFSTFTLWVYMGKPPIQLQAHMPHTTEQTTFQIQSAGFSGNSSQDYTFTRFTIHLLITSGQLEVIAIQTNLAHWFIDGLNKTVSKDNILTITMIPDSGATVLKDHQDISQYYITLQLNIGYSLTWRNWTTTIQQL